MTGLRPGVGDPHDGEVVGFDTSGGGGGCTINGMIKCCILEGDGYGQHSPFHSTLRMEHPSPQRCNVLLSLDGGMLYLWGGGGGAL